ncbi:hypothetical protein [Pseudomonas sp. NA-150]|uniref:hypothetical protein n=1 Tax=Pseudomonas sp. NA-150 TaxID=3367525 RepID=UPI0037CCA646
MALDQISCSILGSLMLIAIYLGLSLYHKQPPDLSHALIIAMSSSGVVAAVALGSLTYFSEPENLGVLKDQKASILIGTLAMTWVSVVSAYSSVMHPLRAAKQSGPVQS